MPISMPSAEKAVIFWFDDFAMGSAPAWGGDIDGAVKVTGGERPYGGKSA